MKDHYKFVNYPLPYDYNSLEPYIDEKTMKLHHDRHLQTYIDNLNKALSIYSDIQMLSLEQLLMNIASLPDEIQTVVKNNAGGVYNHRFYFDGLINPSEKIPVGRLAKAITQEFENYDTFRAKFKETALSVFGSGYAWLVLDAFGKPAIVKTANQDTPLSMGFYPLLNIDVWEHAYYLKHYNLRADYIDDWFNVINWSRADNLYMKFFGMI